MKISANLGFLLVLLTFSCVPGREVTAPSATVIGTYDPYPARPKLVVGIVVDQMRYDYLYRYWNRYGEGGFKRLMRKGFSCENTLINYVPTYTAPGHAAIYTGTTPAVNGIAGNEWYDRQWQGDRYCVADTAVNPIGTTDKAGKMSPRSLQVSTVTDELKLAMNGRSKVVGVSLKDRGSILPAGHTGTAYWFEGNEGKWISSSYYIEELPAWVVNYNTRNRAGEHLENDWNTLYPIESYTLSTADDVPYEKPYKGEEAPVFPHRLPKLKGDEMNIIKETPFGNTLTKEFAMVAIEGEALGQDSIPDFLAVSFSSTDYIGHRFGTQAIETEDTYLRLDKELEEFLNYLDAKVGEGNYLLFLTADHGAALNIQYSNSSSVNVPAGSFNAKKTLSSLNDHLKERYGDKKWILDYENQQVYLDRELIGKEGKDLEEVSAAAAAFLGRQEGVAYAVTASQLRAGAVSAMDRLLLNGLHPQRSGDVCIVLEPGWMEHGPTGTTHGSGYSYDTHIPLLWYGWHIQAGQSSREVHITDIAPTISSLLRIPKPNGCTGQVITEVVK